MMETFFELAKKYEEKLIENRRWLHQNPETGLHLPKTCDYVKAELESMGYTPKFYEGCGSSMSVLVGKYEPEEIGTSIPRAAAIGKKSPRCMLIRGDMDALPIEEESGVSFASTNGNSHSCGHDIHTAILLTIARILKEKENELDGCIKLMFQSGEEGAHGCEKMVKAGILENPRVDAAIALHTKPNYENGTLHYTAGIGTSSTDVFTINIEGEAAHGSTPEKAIDPLFVAANIYMALNGLVARELSAFNSAVLSIGMLNAGTAANIIPEYATICGTIRCYGEEDRQKILNRLDTIVRCEAEMGRTKYDIEMLSTPSCYNSPKLYEALAPALSKSLGEQNLIEERLPEPTSEDFAEISRLVPSILFWYGTGSADNYPLHNPKVIMQEDKLAKAAETMAEAAFTWVNAGADTDFN